MFECLNLSYQKYFVIDKVKSMRKKNHFICQFQSDLSTHKMSAQVKTDICTTTAKINFPNILNQARLVSERVSVPEIDGFW